MSRSPEQWEDMRKFAVSLRTDLYSIIGRMEDWPASFSCEGDEVRQEIEAMLVTLERKFNELVGSVTASFYIDELELKDCDDELPF